MDYLDKYKSAPKKKKKAKELADPVARSTVTVHSRIVPKIATEDDPLAEEPKKKSRGFKRIDTGEKVDVPAPKTEPEQPATVYRDLLGKIVDIAAKQAELAVKKAEQEQPRWQEVRVSEEERAQLNQLPPVGLARAGQTKRDLELEDPMAEFEAPKVDEGLVYTGGVNPPNRFDIPAGVLWDGVDRSNGFEERLLAKRSGDIHSMKEAKLADNYHEEDYGE